ncbi:MAG: DNA recombination protein RmuC [Gammaproteobacteria bacterium]|nr:DNA recombination protein RmuC [Gammaproteobacteria bacterium]
MSVTLQLLLLAALVLLAGGLLYVLLRAAAQRQALQLEATELRLRASLAELAQRALRENSDTFLQLARESFAREQTSMQGALREREAALTQLVEPIRSALAKTETHMVAMERERRDAFTSLRTQIETLASGQSALQRETRNLVTALRRPEVRGRWGELTLRRVVELAGMSEHSDFSEQPSVGSTQGALRPDLIVHMPDGRDLVVDAKTPLDAYLEAIDAASDDARRTATARHAQQVEARVRELASKAYWEQFAHSPEFAVLFLPGDQFLSAALAERPELLENALRQSVIVATPSTLIALLKAVAYGWRQAQVAENAAVIRDLGQELHRRLGSFVAHLARTGQRLEGAVEAYNNAVGSLERQVLPQARRFIELGAATGSELPPAEAIERLVRTPAPHDSDTPRS